MLRITIATILAIIWGYIGASFLTPFDGIVTGVVVFGLLLMMFGVLDSEHDSRSFRNDLEPWEGNHLDDYPPRRGEW